MFHEKQDFYIYGMYVSLYCKKWLIMLNLQSIRMLYT